MVTKFDVMRLAKEKIPYTTRNVATFRTRNLTAAKLCEIGNCGKFGN